MVTLLCFGYRLAISVLERGIRGFFSRIVGFVCRFVVTEKIAQWIADQGGWVRSVLPVLTNECIVEDVEQTKNEWCLT